MGYWWLRRLCGSYIYFRANSSTFPKIYIMATIQEKTWQYYCMNTLLNMYCNLLPKSCLHSRYTMHALYTGHNNIKHENHTLPILLSQTIYYLKASQTFYYFFYDILYTNLGITAHITHMDITSSMATRSESTTHTALSMTNTTESHGPRYSRHGTPSSSHESYCSKHGNTIKM